ncbi:hypothetical protein LINPERHAP1_LOCUS18535, partial [Linum perenne]
PHNDLVSRPDLADRVSSEFGLPEGYFPIVCPQRSKLSADMARDIAEEHASRVLGGLDDVKAGDFNPAMGKVFQKHYEMMLALSVADKSREVLLRKAREIRDDQEETQRSLDAEQSAHQVTRVELGRLKEDHLTLTRDLGETVVAKDRLARELGEAKATISATAKKLQDQEALQRERDAAVAAKNREPELLKRLTQLTEERDKAVKLAQ